MRRGIALIVLLAAAALLAAPAAAKQAREVPVARPTEPRYPNTLFWYDDIEGSVSGWSTVDNTAGATPHFHVDAYMAYGGTGSSWWCGTFDYDANGGYGNGWTDLLELPPVDWTGYTYPVLNYAFRCDSELTYDFSWAQAESGGAYVNLNRGYDGVRPWAVVGHYLANKDNPAVCRFRFASDGAWSDEDGNDTVGGGFACDDVTVFDYITMTVFFFDDAEGGGLCTPAVPDAAGDYWHVVVDLCSSATPPHSWWCGDDADTSLIPPNLNNSLITPAVNIMGALTCTLRMAIHAEVPTVDNDYWNNSVSFDGGTIWYTLSSWWGDFEQCDGWASAGIEGEPLDTFLPADQVQYKLTFATTDNGCGPGAAGGAGINLDDTWFEGVHESAVEPASWGYIKALYR